MRIDQPGARLPDLSNAERSTAPAGKTRPDDLPRLQDQRPEDVEKITEKLNQTAAIFNRSIRFEAIGHHRISIKVIDTETGDVIREVPPEALVRAFERMDEFLGFMLDHKA